MPDGNFRPGLIIVACRPEHLAAFGDAPLELLGRLDAAADLLCNEFAEVGLMNGSPVMACGIIVHWRGKDDRGRACGTGEAWARVGNVPRRHWPEITRRCVAMLDRAAGDGIRLIEATVDVGFGAGHRWAVRLGFRVACLRPGWGITGNDGVLYQRFRPPQTGDPPRTGGVV